MKNKGFTLVELLAVVVIISILVTLAIAGITQQVLNSRKEAFVDNAKKVAVAITDNIKSGEYEQLEGVLETENCYLYDKTSIESILEKDLSDSPFGGTYRDLEARVDKENGKLIVNLCMIDSDNNGFKYTKISDVSTDIVSIGEVSSCK